MRNAGLIRLINSLPSDIWELSPEGHEVRLPRRMSGQAPLNWYGQSHKALTTMLTPISLPFTIILFGRKHRLDKYKDWIAAHSFPLTVLAEEGGTISYSEFGLQKLQDHFLRICDALDGQIKPDQLTAARSQIAAWSAPPPRELGYKVGAHNAVAPNLAALRTAGFFDTVDGPFVEISKGIQPYVDMIARTTRSILEERERIGKREADKHFRRPPAINLFAPAIYPHFHSISLASSPLSPEEQKAFATVRRMLQRQSGYGFEARTEAQARAVQIKEPGGEPNIHPIIRERAAELSLSTECVSTLSASEVSAVLRLPNSVNRTSGQVRQFAQHYHSKTSSERKRQNSFKEIQRKINLSIPNEFFPFIENATDGVRNISDTHLEWAEIRGLPLCVQKDMTKISVTPGNLFIDQVTPKQYLHFNSSNFNEILILSALDEEDPISPFLRIAIDTFEANFRNNIRIKTEIIRNLQDLVKALNSFNGQIMIFDGHGNHEEGKAATLQLIDEKVDVWQLQKERPRIPPVVVLSACDTHAADRNHASTANGFLSIGARTVLASVFPIDARDAATFVARLLYRIADYVPAAHKAFGRSLTWMEIMGGMIRMQLLTDFCHRLRSKNLLNEEQWRHVHLRGNLAINGHAPWPFEEIVDELRALGIDKQSAWHVLRGAVANSTSISYVQMGRPETILIHPENASL